MDTSSEFRYEGFLLIQGHCSAQPCVSVQSVAKTWQECREDRILQGEFE